MQMLFKETKVDPCRFSIKIAGVVVGIKARYSSTYFLCRDYLSDDDPMVYVSTTEEEIDREIQKSGKFFYTCKEFAGSEKDRNTSREINKSVVEPIVIYRKIIEELLAFDILFIHGAAVGTGGRAFLFTAPSGTGKTTHIMKWIEHSDNTYIVNGDKPLLRITDTGVEVCGTPWCGKEYYGENKTVPLKAIVLMERSEENHIEEVPFSQAYTFLLRQIYLPEEAEKVKKTIKLLSMLTNRLRFFKFQFNNFTDDCFDISYNMLTGI